MKSSGSDEQLSGLLAAWRVAPARNPEFRTAVHARVARRSGSWTGFARGHAALVAGALAVAMALGGWAGRDQAKARVEHDRAQIAAEYVQSYDARAMPMP